MTLDDIITVAQQISTSSLPTQLKDLDLPAGLEPMTAFTDAILAAWTAFLAGSIFSRANGRRAVLLWGWAFIATVISSLAGVAYHGWRIFFEPLLPMTVLSWKFVPIATGIAAFCLGSAAAIVWLRPAARKIAFAILILEFIVCVVASVPVRNNSFAIAGAAYLLVMIAVAIGCAKHWGQKASRFIAAGIGVSVVAIAVQMSPIETRYFDHNDIFHIIQLAAMYLLYRGGVSLGEADDAPFIAEITPQLDRSAA